LRVKRGTEEGGNNDSQLGGPVADNNQERKANMPGGSRKEGKDTRKKKNRVP